MTDSEKKRSFAEMIERIDSLRRTSNRQVVIGWTDGTEATIRRRPGESLGQAIARAVMAHNGGK